MPQFQNLLSQEIFDQRQGITGHRLRQHGERFLVHVHQADATLRMPRHHLQGTWLPQGPDVVHDISPQVQGSLHHFWLVGIDRNRYLPSQCFLQKWQHALQLFFDADGLCTRPRRLSADVQNVGSLSQQGLSIFKRNGQGTVPPPIRKRIGCEIHNTHDFGLGEVDREPRGLPNGLGHELQRIWKFTSAA